MIPRRAWCAAVAIGAAVLAGCGAPASPAATSATDGAPSPSVTPGATATPVPESHAPDHTRLPLGDGKYSTQARAGYVYACSTTFDGGGASAYGPWIDTAGGTWDLSRKVEVDGDVSWPASRDISVSGAQRVVASNDLPDGHTTGTYPIARSDDAYQYDSNPNSISSQQISMTVPATPQVATSPTCVGGEVGIATTGVLIFSAFDAGGRDAVAVEVQDHCEGHPQAGGFYHYHGYSSCFTDPGEPAGHSGLLGYAFDGFGIFGVRGEDGGELSSSDLDVCHGHTHAIEWDGQTVVMYHYHFTFDFPYTVACFRGEPAVRALSAGEGGAGGGAPAGGGEGGGQGGGAGSGGENPPPPGEGGKPPPPPPG